MPKIRFKFRIHIIDLQQNLISKLKFKQMNTAWHMKIEMALYPKCYSSRIKTSKRVFLSPLNFPAAFRIVQFSSTKWVVFSRTSSKVILLGTRQKRVYFDFLNSYFELCSKVSTLATDGHPDFEKQLDISDSSSFTLVTCFE